MILFLTDTLPTDWPGAFESIVTTPSLYPLSLNFQSSTDILLRGAILDDDTAARGLGSVVRLVRCPGARRWTPRRPSPTGSTPGTVGALVAIHAVGVAVVDSAHTSPRRTSRSSQASMGNVGHERLDRGWLFGGGVDLPVLKHGRAAGSLSVLVNGVERQHLVLERLLLGPPRVETEGCQSEDQKDTAHRSSRYHGSLGRGRGGAVGGSRIGHAAGGICLSRCARVGGAHGGGGCRGWGGRRGR